MKILVYIEPHPIRNWRDEFRCVGTRLALAAEKFCLRGGHELRIVSNDDICDHIAESQPYLAHKLSRLTIEETECLLSFDCCWQEESIENWVRLTRGEGPMLDFYCQILARVWSKFPFDCILTWSENGAVRKFAKEVGALALHFELGPTRAPFPETFYLDPLGTNGNASVSLLPESFFPAGLPSGHAYIAKQSALIADETQPGVEDSVWSIAADKGEIRPFDTPYIFVPLQLADDLNTLSHSRFKSPREFLEEVLPAAKDQGLKVAVKGHPAAAARPYNLTREIDAIRYAKTFGDQLLIVPSNISAPSSLRLIGQALGILSINSSISFEARLIGKKSACLGRAVFAGCHSKDAEEAIHALTEDKATTCLRSAWLMRSYLFPIQSFEDGSALDVAIPLMMEEHYQGGNFGPEFWKSWAESVFFGERWLISRRDGPIKQTASIIGWSKLLDGTKKSIVIDGGSMLLNAATTNGSDWASADLDERCFRGSIDVVDVINEELTIKGWALDVLGMRPPVCVMVININDLSVLSTHRVIMPRPDVRNALSRNVAKRCGFEFKVLIGNNCLRAFRLAMVSSDNTVQFAELVPGTALEA